MHRWVEQEAWGKVREKTNRVSCDESRPSEKSFQRPPQSPQHLSAQGLHSVQKKMQQMKHQATPDSPQAVRREEAGEGARPSLGHVTAGPLSAGVPKAHLRVGWGFWVQLPLCAAVFFKSHSLHFQIKGFFSFFFPIVLWWRSVWIRSFLSVKNLPNLERKQMWPSLVPLLVSRVSSHSILTFCFLHHLCSSQFYTQFPRHRINMPLSKKKVKLSLSPQLLDTKALLLPHKGLQELSSKRTMSSKPPGGGSHWTPRGTRSPGATTGPSIE